MGKHKAVPDKSKLKKDPGVPRLPRLKARHANQQHRQFRVAAPTTIDNVSPSFSSMLAAQSSAHEQENEQENGDYNTRTRTIEQIRRHYLRVLHKVIDESDIVILVLDARDPEGCRSRLVEEEVRRRESEGKKLVFVLNKIDLVPRANAEAWLRYLRHSTPTLPFRSVSSTQRSNLSSSTTPSLLRLLKACRPNAAQSVTVGVVGYPNVGKSSLINSLKRAKVCAVAAQPGHTKDLQSVQLERGIKIIDSPGVVFDDDDDHSRGGGAGTSKGNILLRNVIKVEDVEDPIAVVEEIQARTDAETLQKIYKLPPFGSAREFLTMLALTHGRLLKGGAPDILATARSVLKDWNQQKIPYFSVPPAIHPSSVPDPVPAPGAENVGQAQILAELGKPFELEGLFGAADSGAFGILGADEAPNTADTGPAGQSDDIGAMEDDGALMEGEGDTYVNPRKRSRSLSSVACMSPASPPQDRAPAFVDDGDWGGRPMPTRAPKRLRRSKVLSDTHERMAEHNPLSRRALKKEAKKARRANRPRTSAGGGDGMEIDDGLGFMFTA